MTSANFDPFSGGVIARVAPTTEPQREILTSARMSDIANTAFNEGIVITFPGDVDLKLIEKCLNEIHKRHDSLRTTFAPSGKEMCLMEDCELVLNVVDLSEESHARANIELEKLLRNIAISPMNLDEGPLIFTWAYLMPDSETKLVIVVHHIVCDGWSFGILLDELQKLYNSKCDQKVLAEPSSFLDYAEKKNASIALNSDIDYWLDKYRLLPDSIDLPIDYERPVVRTFEAQRLDYIIPKEITGRIPSISTSLNASVVNIILTGYIILLNKLSGSDDVVVGLPLAGQTASGDYNLFGHAVQLLPIRIAVDEKVTFKQLLSSVKKAVLDASDHPDFTYGKLIENFPAGRSRVPLVNTIFNIDQPVDNIEIGGSIVRVNSIPRASENFEIFLNVVPEKDKVTIEATYSSVLFAEESINSWLKVLAKIISQSMDNPELAINQYVLTDNVPDVLRIINSTGKSISSASVLDEFNYQVNDNGDLIAVVSNRKSYSYKELNRLADSIARELIKNRLNRSLVGVCADRSEVMLAAVLGILKAGCAYLPLDPEFPVERLEYMLEDSNARALCYDDKAPSVLIAKDILQVDLDCLHPENYSEDPMVSVEILPDQLAYMIYTSGSTGKPKGVAINHASMINFIKSMEDRPGIDSDDVVLALTTLSFDISVLELFLPICTGSTVVIASQEDSRDGNKLIELIEENDVSLVQATPGTWRMLFTSGLFNKRDVKRLKALVGGEPLPSDLVKDLLPYVKELWNMYGPTETTVWSTCKRIDSDIKRISIGYPISNTSIYILDQNKSLMPVSVPGEIAIGGTGLAVGYNNQPNLTDEKFYHHPDFGRIYLTGDLGKIQPDGEIIHLGRIDDQVKLRGFRIELGEIETVLNACEGIEQCSVYLWEISEEDIRIVACCVTQNAQEIETVSIRRDLRKKLPAYMIPQYFLRIDSIPRTPNGKINRRSLPTPELSASIGLDGGKLEGQIEKDIGDIWREILVSAKEIGREDNFFEVGGHSLLALEFIRRIESLHDVRLTPEDVVTKSLEKLAAKISHSRKGDDDNASTPVALPQTITRHPTLDQLSMLEKQGRDPSLTHWNLPAAWILTGDLDKDLIIKCIQMLIERQSALRTTIHKGENGITLSLLPPQAAVSVDVQDFSEEEDARVSAIDYVTRASAEPFELGSGPLIRVSLCLIDDNAKLLGIVPHQIIFDGWSFDIFLKELEEYYIAAIENRHPVLQPLKLQFRDYCEWLNNEGVNADHVEYHKNSLRVTSKTQLINESNSTRGQVERCTVKISADALAEIEKFSSSHGWRLHETLFSVYMQSLYEVSQQRELMIALPVTGRYMPESIGLIGSFMSSHPVTFRIEESRTTGSLGNIIDQLRDFYRHEKISQGQLLRELGEDFKDIMSLIPYTFAFQDIRKRPVEFGKLRLEQIDIPRAQLEYPLEAWVRVESTGLLLNVDYDTARVGKEMAENLLGKMQEIFREIIENRLESSNRLEATPSQEGKGFWRKLFR